MANVTLTASGLLLTTYDSNNLTGRKEQVVAELMAERVTLGIFCGILLLLAVCGNVMVLSLLIRHRTLRSPYTSCIALLAVNDLVMVTVYHLPVFVYTTTNIAMEANPVICGINRFARIVSIGIGSHMLVVLAYERYTFLTAPIRYLTLWTRKRLGFIIGFICAINFAVGCVTVGFVTGGKFYHTAMTCRQRGLNIKATVVVFFGFLCFPNMIINSVIIYRLTQVYHTTRTSVAPADVTVLSVIGSSIKSGIRIIFLTSGLFWMTLFPPGVVKLVMTQTGVGFEELENNSRPITRLIFRLADLVPFAVAPSLNPVIYFYVSMSLRKKLLQDLSRLRRLWSHMFSKRNHVVHVNPIELN